MKEYILNLLEEEKNIVEELLTIDNNVQKTNYTYEEIYKLIYNTNIINNTLDKKYMVITDGEIGTIFNIIFNYTENIICININHMSVAFNMWLIKRINEYKNLDIILDKDNNYELYDKFNDIIITGFKEFVAGTKDMYVGKNIVEIIYE